MPLCSFPFHFSQTKWTSGFWQRRWKCMIKFSWNLTEQIPQTDLTELGPPHPSYPSFTQVAFTRLPLGDNLNLTPHTPCWSRSMDSPRFKFDVEASGGCLVRNCSPEYESQRTWWHDEWRSTSGKAALPNTQRYGRSCGNSILRQVPVMLRLLSWSRNQVKEGAWSFGS